ncbi:distal tail protein Dit [Senegalia massiliensis]|uniref:distal tail protein Dit n=1 Tax=Senegalia massiliensis TaxID=1720316 RepID=UPI00102FE44C|nr:distal tail protein Dit [Senegalia massiliensis]
MLNLIFNNTDFSEYVNIENVRKSILPPISTNMITIPGKRGLTFIKNNLEVKYIEVDIRLIEENKNKVRDKMRELAKLLYTKEPKKLVTDENDKYDIAILDGNTEFEKLLYTGSTTLVFACPDPISYGEEITETLDDNILLNNGTYETKGIINVQINSNITYIKITLLDTGEFLYIENNFVTGDEVVIDLEKESIRKNGVLIMEDLYLESDFFSIPTGEYQIKIEPLGVYATLSYIERWL